MIRQRYLEPASGRNLKSGVLLILCLKSGYDLNKFFKMSKVMEIRAAHIKKVLGRFSSGQPRRCHMAATESDQMAPNNL